MSNQCGVPGDINTYNYFSWVGKPVYGRPFSEMYGYLPPFPGSLLIDEAGALVTDETGNYLLIGTANDLARFV